MKSADLSPSSSGKGARSFRCCSRGRCRLARWIARTGEQLVARSCELLAAAGPLDGLLVAPHGAAVCAGIADFDGRLLTQVRQQIGAAIPMVCTIDPHANLSAAMVEACDAVIAYRTNPHLDQRDRGIEAAALLLRHMRGEIRLQTAAAFPPLVINIERQRTAAEPCVSLYAMADDIRRRPGVVSVSVVLGFPVFRRQRNGGGLCRFDRREPLPPPSHWPTSWPTSPGSIEPIISGS